MNGVLIVIFAKIGGVVVPESIDNFLQLVPHFLAAVEKGWPLREE